MKNFFFFSVPTGLLIEMEGTSETGECVPAPSKKRLKRIAAKKLKREAKRAKYEELSSVPGPSTISERELAETTVFIKEGMVPKQYLSDTIMALEGEMKD